MHLSIQFPKREHFIFVFRNCWLCQKSLWGPFPCSKISKIPECSTNRLAQALLESFLQKTWFRKMKSYSILLSDHGNKCITPKALHFPVNFPSNSVTKLNLSHLQRDLCCSPNHYHHILLPQTLTSNVMIIFFPLLHFQYSKFWSFTALRPHTHCVSTNPEIFTESNCQIKANSVHQFRPGLYIQKQRELRDGRRGTHSL